MSGFLVALIVVVHVAVCVALMASILLQSGKGGGLAGAFGAGSSQTLFGGRGAATFLSRATTALAVVFFITSLTLGLQASRGGSAQRSLIQEEAQKRSRVPGGAGAPALPGTGAPAPGTQGATPAAQQAPAPAPGSPATGTAPGTPAPGAPANAPPATGATK